MNCRLRAHSRWSSRIIRWTRLRLTSHPSRFQFGRNSPAAVGGPIQCDLLDLIAQIHIRRRGFHRIEKAVVAGAAEPGYFAHLEHAHPGACVYFFLDLFVECAPLCRARSRRCSSTCCKARFKKSISIVCRPILRSSSAILVSSARFFPAPLNARSPCSCNSRRHRCRSLGCTSSARATSAAVCPLLSRFTAVCLNSLLNFLRDFIVRFTSFAEI